MAALPRLAMFRAHGRRWGVVHGGATAANRFLWPTSKEAGFAEEIAALEAVASPVDAVLAGHCGLPFLREVAGRLWFNPGALGLPPNDGDPSTSYGVIAADGPRIERLRYDHDGAAAAMRAAGLTPGLRTRAGKRLVAQRGSLAARFAPGRLRSRLKRILRSIRFTLCFP